MSDFIYLGGDMANKNIAKIVEVGGLAFLGGTAWVLARKNEKLQDNIKKLRKDFMKQKGNLELLKKTLRLTHDKYMNLRDGLKGHVESMVNLKDNKEWSKDTKILTEKFPEMDLQFMAPDILIAKLSGLIDAFILNKWSIVPSEYKKIKKSMLSNGEKLDIYSKDDLKLVLDVLIKINSISMVHYTFLLKFYDYYKKKIIIDGDIPKDYDNDEIEYFFNFTVKMVLENL